LAHAAGILTLGAAAGRNLGVRGAAKPVLSQRNGRFCGSPRPPEKFENHWRLPSGV